MSRAGQERVRKIFDTTGAGALFITDPHNVGYISGFMGEGMLYLSRNRNVIITDSRYTEAAARQSDFEIIEEKNSHRRVNILRECISSDGIDIVGYEDNYMKCSEFSRYANGLQEVQQWLPLENQINAIRRIKTPEELECLAKAEAVGDAAFADILNILKPGMTELETAAELEYRMKKHGAQGLSFDTIIASGLNSSMPHAVPGNKKLETGDFVTMDFGCVIDGYCSDMTRTVVLGKADEKQKEIYSIVLRAQTEALSVLKAGMKGSEVDAVARNIIRAAGYGAYFGHGLGHSVGLYIHEDPRLSPTDDTVLEENMIETVEPGIYVPGFGGVRIEDMVVVTADGCRNLAHSPKELIEL